jgi:hypothetical protein
MKRIIISAIALIASCMAMAQTSDVNTRSFSYDLSDGDKLIYMLRQMAPQGKDTYKLVIPSDVTGEKAAVIFIGNTAQECVQSLDKLIEKSKRSAKFRLQDYTICVHSIGGVYSICHEGDLANMRGGYLFDTSNLKRAKQALLIIDGKVCPYCGKTVCEYWESLKRQSRYN